MPNPGGDAGLAFPRIGCGSGWIPGVTSLEPPQRAGQTTQLQGLLPDLGVQGLEVDLSRCLNFPDHLYRAT